MPKQFYISIGIFVSIVLFTMLLEIFTTSSEDTSAASTYRLYYVDNGVGCVSCLQSKQSAKKIAQALNLQSKESFILINTYNNEKPELRKECKLFAGILMVVRYENGKRVAIKKFDMNEAILYQDNPMEYVTKISEAITLFMLENEK